MEEAGTEINSVTIKQYKPNSGYVCYCNVYDGLFYHLGIPPGSHQIENFNAIKFYRDNFLYYYKPGQTGIRIKQPGVYFIGSFKLKVIESNFFKEDSYKMMMVSEPNEKTLLFKILKICKEKKYGRQIRMIEHRLEELN